MPINLANRSVLVVEDEAFSRAILVRMLATMGAPTVYQAANGEEAMQYLWTVPLLSFVISDLNMPVINGLQVLKSVRSGQCGVDRALPFAMLTGYSDKSFVDIALKLDVNSFVIKPVSKEGLEKRLEHLLRSARDLSWLKPAEMYQHVDTKIFVEPRHDAAPERDAVRDRAEAVARVSAEIATGGRNREYRGRQIPKARKASGGKFTKSDIAGSLGERFSDADLVHAGGSSVVGRLSALRGKFQDSDLAGSIAAGISHLVAEIGDESASNVVGLFDTLERRGQISLGDIAGALAIGPGAGAVRGSSPDRLGDNWKEELRALSEVPVGSVLARDIRTQDGEVFIRAGIRMSQLIISVLTHLDALKVLALEKVGAGAARSAIRVEIDGGVPGGGVPDPQESVIDIPGQARLVDLADVQDGAVLARGIYTVDGNLYLPAGATITPRILALLQDLRELEKLLEPIWIIA